MSLWQSLVQSTSRIIILQSLFIWLTDISNILFIWTAVTRFWSFRLIVDGYVLFSWFGCFYQALLSGDLDYLLENQCSKSWFCFLFLFPFFSLIPISVILVSVFISWYNLSCVNLLMYILALLLLKVWPAQFSQK